MDINTDQLKTLLGSEEAARRFVAMFLDKLPEQMATLRKSLAAGDTDTASITAHNLKSQFRYMGLTAGADLLQMLENDPANAHAMTWVDSIAGLI